MAGAKPFFVTGANAKIRINGRTIAFCTDVSYKVTVNHASPRVLGRFEVETHQPLSYDVEGSFTIIRYAKDLKSKLDPVAGAASNTGNGIGAWGLSHGNAASRAAGLPSADGQWDGRADESLRPSRMFQSSLFDIEISQKVSNETGGNNAIENFLGVGSGNEGECAIAKLQGCRIEVASFTLNKRSAAIQSFSFKAQYAHEDTFLASKSGVGQELT